MGLNLDLDHVAFAGVRKFDGHTHRNLTLEQAGLLLLDMDLIIDRAEDSLGTTLFCGEPRDAIGDRAVLRSMRTLKANPERYIERNPR